MAEFMHDYTREQVLAKVGQYFPREDPAVVMSILDEYGMGQPGRERVQLAIIRLSEGNIDNLLHYTQTAIQDYRDVLAWSEYPGEFAIPPHEVEAMPPDAVKKMRDADRAQLLDWLKSKAGERPK